MSEIATPEKIVKKRGRQQKEASVNDNCRFCERKLTSTGGNNTTFENLFKPLRRQETLNLILADACESVGFRLARSESLSERVCRPCGRKIRNAAELYNFIKEAVSSTKAQEEKSDATRVDDAETIKRQLPSTVTPERTIAKKLEQENNEHLPQKTGHDRICRKTLFSDSREDSAVEDHGSLIPIALEENDIESSNENDDFIKNFFNIETIDAKEDTQLKVYCLPKHRKCRGQGNI